MGKWAVVAAQKIRWERFLGLLFINVVQKIFVHIDGGLSGESHMRTPRSKDPIGVSQNSWIFDSCVIKKKRSWIIRPKPERREAEVSFTNIWFRLNRSRNIWLRLFFITRESNIQEFWLMPINLKGNPFLVSSFNCLLIPQLILWADPCQTYFQQVNVIHG